MQCQWSRLLHVFSKWIRLGIYLEPAVIVHLHPAFKGDHMMCFIMSLCVQLLMCLTLCKNVFKKTPPPPHPSNALLKSLLHLCLASLHKKRGSVLLSGRVSLIVEQPKLKIREKVFFWKDWYTKRIKHIGCLYHNNTLTIWWTEGALQPSEKKFELGKECKECSSWVGPACTGLCTLGFLFALHWSCFYSCSLLSE